jgi:DNA ligase-1
MFKPLLAWKPEKDQVLEEELAKLTVWPRLVSRKLDGIRATAQKNVLKSRTLKDIPNAAIQDMFKGLPEGLDGELIYGEPNAPDVFNKTSSIVMGNKPMHQQMAREGVKYYLFDWYDAVTPFVERYKALKEFFALKPAGIAAPLKLVEHYLVKDLAAVLRFEEKWVVNEGFEGVMLRSLEGLYKEGRSTFNEGYLLKVKRFSDSEAEVINTFEEEHNTNEAEVNELGRTKRSSAKAGMVGKGTLGGLNVRDLETGVEFSIGTGFTAQDRVNLWAERDMLVGRVVKYKSLKVGEVEKPRHPVWLGWRSKEDM